MEEKKIIKRSKVIGYCMGVKKAVDTAIKMREFYPSSKVYTLGELIHNPTTLKKLENMNIEVLSENRLDNTNFGKDDIVIIRAHGVPPSTIEKLAKKKIKIIDCTCPRVVANRKLAQKCAKDGVVILIGDKNHPELISIYGYVLENASATCLILQNEVEAKALYIQHPKLPHYLIAQTTIKEEEFIAIKTILEKKIEDLHVFNTICKATFERQEALKKLVEEVDATLIIGGKNSANTKRLFMTAIEMNKKAYLIENSLDLPKEIEECKVIGLASGASTPDDIIDEIEKAIES